MPKIAEAPARIVTSPPDECLSVLSQANARINRKARDDLAMFEKAFGCGSDAAPLASKNIENQPWILSCAASYAINDMQASSRQRSACLRGRRDWRRGNRMHRAYFTRVEAMRGGAADGVT